ncbi:MAG: multidrug efflux RND transporter permease subunit [Odoribacter sp.]|nr:multidrug efflux RND transporter permease subunit [Odoribacter sp.]
MFSKFFINRPIFASVLSIILVVTGAASMIFLPIEQYPPITPPIVTVSAEYPGADATTIAKLVGEPLEDQINGVEGMTYMSSTSSSTGTYSLMVTFDVGTDANMDAILVQNRVNEALSSLPETVQKMGVTTEKMSTNVVLFVTLKSEVPEIFNSLYLSNYASLNILKSLERLPGVGGVTLFGAGDYSMRIWLNPDALAIRGLTPLDIQSAIEAQNIQIAGGSIGAAPQSDNVPWQFTVNMQGEFETPEEFENIIISTSTDGGILKLKDVATVELGRATYTSDSKLRDEPTAAIAIYQLPGANDLNVAKAVKAEMENLKKFFPEGVDYEVAYDTTTFITASIDGLYSTLITAFILVMLVILVFLQNWHALFIPMITIPISLIGTFAFVSIMGFSINTLTLFALVLAVGLVVDDAIVIVENSYRIIETGQYKSIKESVIQAMKEVEGVVIGIVLVLLAVFLPTAFVGGIPGEMYRQFSLTIAVATVISGFNALTMTPALCALFIKRGEATKFKPFLWFNAKFDKLTHYYSKVIKASLKRPYVTLVIFLILTAGAIWGFMRQPSTFLPSEDQGYFMAFIQMPNGASLQQTEKYSEQAADIVKRLPGVETYLTINGFSMMQNAGSSNSATLFVVLKNWDERKSPNESVFSLVEQFNEMAAAEIQQAECFAVAPPAIPGMGQNNGFQAMLEDINSKGPKELQIVTDEIIAKSATNKGLSNVLSLFSANVPQYYLDIDRDRASLMGINLESLFAEISAYLGSNYVNNFVKFDKSYQVMIEGSGDIRRTIDALHRLQIKNSQGDMVPLTAFTTIQSTTGPELLTRYNTYLASSIIGSPNSGYSSGQALDSIAAVIQSVAGDQYNFEWTAMAYAETHAGNTIILIFVLAIIMAYLILAAQYESWTSPVAVLLGLPISILGVVIGCKIMGQAISLYTQIGIVLLIALTAKNAILIVAFARDYHAAGKGIDEAALEGGRTRFRPILMTSFAFILGTFPLVIATGAGAASRISLGIAVFAGMIMSSFIGTLFVPAFYKIMQTLQERRCR